MGKFYFKFKQIINSYPLTKRVGFSKHTILLIFFPITLLFTNTFRVLFSYLHSLKLIFRNDNLSDFSLFKPLYGINSLFYRTQFFNLNKLGRRGISQYISTGNYHLGQWWWCSTFSLALSKKLGSLLTPIFMSIWLLTFLVFIQSSENIPPIKLVLVLFLVLVSTYYYCASFIYLNYNVVGWSIFPIFIFSLIEKKIILATSCLLAISFGSLTVVFIGSIFVLSAIIFFQNIYFIFIIFPAIFNILSRFRYSLDIKKSIDTITRAIGFSKSEGIKYKHNKNLSKVFNYYSIYFLFTWILFLVINIFYSSSNTFLLYLLSASLILYLTNLVIFRFADQQSLYMTILTISTCSVFYSNSVWLMISFWIAISPLPLVLSGDSPNSISPLFEKSFKPFHIKPLIEITREFLSSVSENSRILLVNEDPNNNYEEIWGIYKSMNELLFYSANLNSILIFPDFYAIASNNKTFSHGFWGTGINEVNQNLTYWDAKYIIITQYSGTKLDQKWERGGFVKISQLDWGEFYYLLGNEPCWESRFSPPPKYFLLMRNK